MVRREARKYGLSKEQIEMIKPDNDGLQANDDSENLVTVLLYFWKDEKTDTVHFTKSTEHVFLINDTDLGYKLYPISCFGWDPIKNSYLYNSPMTANIENQVFINKSLNIFWLSAVNKNSFYVIFSTFFYFFTNNFMRKIVPFC